MPFVRRWFILLGLIAALLVPELAAAAEPAPAGDQSQQPQGQQVDSRSPRPDYVPTEPGLEPGDEGDNVERMQAYLEKFGYLSRSRRARGQFDQPTEDALRQFQRRYDLAATGELDVPTFELMNTPRYDQYADIGAVADYTIPYSKWGKTSLTYGFANFSTDLSQSAVRSGIAEALALWSEATPLTFTESAVTSSYDPDIIIRFASGDHGDGNSFDGPGGVLAHAYIPYQGSPIDGDAHFDEAENWSVAIPPVSGWIDLVSVAAHEFGHSLGLGHSEAAGALMNPYYSGVHRYLGSDDVAGIQSLYGSDDGTHDAAVSSLSATPTTVTRGGQVTISAQITNNGTVGESVTVDVGTNTGSFNDSRTVSLAAGASTTTSFTWQTDTLTMTGDHVVTVIASVPGDASSSNNSASTVVTVQEAQPSGDLYITGIDFNSWDFGSRYRLYAKVYVGSDDGVVSGADVTATLSGPNGYSRTMAQSSTTSGYANFVVYVYQPGIYSLNVTNVSKSGWTYDSDQNSGNPATVNTGGVEPPETHDAAVTSVSAPASAVQGDTVTVSVQVKNNGSVSDDIAVNIDESPAGFNDSRTVNLAAGAATTVDFSWATGSGTSTGDHTFTASVAVADDNDGGNNSGTATMTIEAAGGGESHDGEVVSVSAPASVTQGSDVTLTAMVRNNGSVSDDITVNISKTPAGFDDAQTVSLVAGASTSVTFTWATGAATPTGDHTFTVTASVTGDDNDGNDSASATTTVEAASGGGEGMHVSNIDFNSWDFGSRYRLYAKVYVESGGSAVPGASVTATLTGPNGYSRTMTQTVTTSGYANFVVYVYSGGAYTITVSELAKSGETYNPDLDAGNPATVNTGGEEPAETHDAAVTSVSAPASVTQGNTATISATVKNNGTVSESVTVSISKDPAGYADSTEVTLAAGTSQTVTFDWVTDNSTPTGDHAFTVTASVDSDSNSGNNTGTATTSVQAEQSGGGGGDQMHVSDIDFRFWDFGSRYRLYAKIFIESGDVPVPNADVTARMTGPNGYSRTMTQTVTSSGYANFVVYVYSPGEYTITVTDVEKSSEIYNSDQNVVTSVAVTAS